MTRQSILQRLDAECHFHCDRQPPRFAGQFCRCQAKTPLVAPFRLAGPALSWKKQIVIRGYYNDLPAKAPCELGRIPRISEAEKNAVTLVDFSETPNAKFFAMLETELDHRIQFATKTALGHAQLDESGSTMNAEGVSPFKLGIAEPLSLLLVNALSARGRRDSSDR